MKILDKIYPKIPPRVVGNWRMLTSPFFKASSKTKKFLKWIWGEIRALANTRIRGRFHEHQFHYQGALLGKDKGHIDLICGYSIWGYYCGKHLTLYYGKANGDIEMTTPFIIKQNENISNH